MKYLFLIITPIILFAKVHYAKVEPYEDIILKSAVSAQVINAPIKFEGTNIKHKVIVHLDDKLDKIKLTSDRESLKLVRNMIDIDRKTLKALKESLEKQKSYYDRIANIQTISITQKDKAFYSYISAKTQYLSTKEKIESLKKQELDLKYDIERLKDTIAKKSITLKNKFLYALLVHKGDFVNMGTPIAQVKDLTKAKLTLFLEDDELNNIKNKKIYINDKETNYKIDKIWSVADSKFISSYKAQIIIPANKYQFSKLLKVELK